MSFDGEARSLVSKESNPVERNSATLGCDCLFRRLKKIYRILKSNYVGNY